MMEMEKEEWYKKKGEEKPQEAAAKKMAGGALEKNGNTANTQNYNYYSLREVCNILSSTKLFNDVCEYISFTFCFT